MQVIHPQNYSYKHRSVKLLLQNFPTRWPMLKTFVCFFRRGWFCVMCRQNYRCHSYKHRCTSKDVENCDNCHRILMIPGKEYCVYKSTKDLYCDSRIKVKSKLCVKCNFIMNSEDCFQNHKMKCKMRWKCPKCNQILKCNPKEGKKEEEKKLHESDCGIRVMINCNVCKGRHQKEDDCFFRPLKYKDFENFPKLMIINGAVSSYSNAECYKCHFRGQENCELHSIIKENRPCINYLSILRENKEHGVFEKNYITEKAGVETPTEYISKPYLPCQGLKPNYLSKTGNYGNRVRKMNLDFVSSYQPENVMDVLLKQVLLDDSYEDTIAVTQG